MTKEELEKELFDLNQRFWLELTMKNFDEVDLIEKKVKRCEALLRIEEDEEDIKPNPSIPDSVLLDFMKRIKKN